MLWCCMAVFDEKEQDLFVPDSEIPEESPLAWHTETEQRGKTQESPDGFFAYGGQGFSSVNWSQSHLIFPENC